MAESRAAFERALEAAADDRQRAPVWLGLADVKRVTEDLDGAFADLDRAQDAAERHDLVEQRAHIHFLRGNLHFPRGNIGLVLEEHEKSLRYAHAAGSTELEAAALGGLGDAEYARGRMLTARGYFERCLVLCRQHGFGRIEVASLPMAAITRFYAGELHEAYLDALAAVVPAERVGHRRAAMIGCHIVLLAAMTQGELGMTRRYAEKAIELSRQLGARRFEAEGLWFLAELQRVDGQRKDALVIMRQGVEISRATGMAYLGPALLGGLARITMDAEERRAALAEGEQLLAAGSISHNHIWFYQQAIEAALEQYAWTEAARYARALADYTRSEPLPYVDCIVARANALAAFGRGQPDRTLVDELRAVRAKAEGFGWRSILPELDATLAVACPDPKADRA
jgi:tetratricopeptide (TPR) repeat protein